MQCLRNLLSLQNFFPGRCFCVVEGKVSKVTKCHIIGLASGVSICRAPPSERNVPAPEKNPRRQKVQCKLYYAFQNFLEAQGNLEGQSVGNFRNITDFDGSGAHFQYPPLAVSLMYFAYS
jgi:hypothetical protein